MLGYQGLDVYAGMDDEAAAREPSMAPGRSTLTSRLAPRPRVELIMRSATGAAIAPHADAALAAAGSSTGAPLPEHLRVDLEREHRGDLGGVRVHTGAASSAAADAIGARAFATGQDIHFAGGAYAPADPFGVHLIAHEVAHTLQQAGGPPQLQRKPATSEPGDGAERDADAFADKVADRVADAAPTIEPAGKKTSTSDNFDEGGGATGDAAAPSPDATAPAAAPSPDAGSTDASHDKPQLDPVVEELRAADARDCDHGDCDHGDAATKAETTDAGTPAPGVAAPPPANACAPPKDKKDRAARIEQTVKTLIPDVGAAFDRKLATEARVVAQERVPHMLARVGKEEAARLAADDAARTAKETALETAALAEIKADFIHLLARAYSTSKRWLYKLAAEIVDCKSDASQVQARLEAQIATVKDRFIALEREFTGFKFRSGGWKGGGFDLPRASKDPAEKIHPRVAPGARVPVPGEPSGPPIAPRAADFTNRLRASAKALGLDLHIYTYGGHDAKKGGGVEEYRLDVEITNGAAVDKRGFFEPTKTTELIVAANDCARQAKLKWRVIYNDFKVAAGVDRKLGKGANGNHVNPQWDHGPFKLHLHFDLYPIEIDNKGVAAGAAMPK